ncbi:MAG: hypothetical protein GAK35_02301 [Herbaspirillum frisingense]|uniref:Uncharacterized protein n=1 Tax=Herbaspirillum frisingense TaxID=92645 RepID=A0A7V8FWC9_9BURK|nr:MAG: hypothetical protein GAK35_02301 [Herbaspirillum frisingense]
MAMRDRFAEFRTAALRLRLAAGDRAMALACRVLLPIATTCKVCNIMRGIVVGIAIGACAATAATLYFGRG